MHFPTARIAAWRLSFLFAAIFLPIGFYMPFFPLWLSGRGLDAKSIGLLLALPPLVRIVSAPLLSRWADRNGRLAATLCACSVLTGLGLFLTGLMPGMVSIGLAVLFTSIFWAPVVALGDSLALATILKHPGIDYGRSRLWGSIAFIAATVCGGWLVAAVAPRHLIWPLAAAALAGAAVTFVAAGKDAGTTASGRVDTPGRIDVAGTALLIAGVSLIQASHAFLYGFGSLAWRANGFGGVFIGFAWAIGVVAEIVLFAFVGRLQRTAGMALRLVVIGGGCAVLRWVLLAQGPGEAFLLVLQTLHGLSFGATHVGAVFLLDVLAAGRGRTTLQGWYAGGSAAGSAVLSWISGSLYERWGEGGFLGMSLAAVAGLALALAALPALRRIETAMDVAR